MYAATYEEASQQVLDEYYLRSGGGAPAGQVRGDTTRGRREEVGKPAASTRTQVSSVQGSCRSSATPDVFRPGC